MKRGVILKVVGLMALVAITIPVTSSLMGQVRSRRTTRVAQSNTTIPATLDEHTFVRGVVDDVDDNFKLSENTRRQSSHVIALRKMSASVTGRQVSVFAKIQIFDRRPDMQYLWGMQVLTPAKQIVFEKLYDEQIFSKTEPEAAPTFGEQVELAPGTYTVRVVLFAIPSNFDITTLQDEAVEKAYVAVGGRQQVTVLN